MIRLKKQGLPTAKLVQSLKVLGTKTAWTLAAFSLARWPARPDALRKGTGVLGVAGKVLRNLEARGLAAHDGDVFRLTEHGRQVLLYQVLRLVRSVQAAARAAAGRQPGGCARNVGRQQERQGSR